MIATMMVLALALQNEELAEVAKKTASMDSYTFKVESKASRGKQQAGAIEGRYQKDQPMALKSAGAEGFRKGGAIVYKEGEEWKRLEKARKGEKKQRPAAASFASVKLPHEELEGLEKSFEKVEKAAEKDRDCSVWSGTLTPTAARVLVSTGGKSDAKDTSTFTGTAKVWVNDQGLIVRYEGTAHVKGENKKGPLEMDVTKTVEISAPGTTRVEVPEAATKLLNSQS